MPAKKKVDTSGMKDMFEEAEKAEQFRVATEAIQKEIEKIDNDISGFEKELEELEKSEINHFTSGNDEKDTRNEILSIKMNIAALQKKREQKIAELSGQTR